MRTSWLADGVTDAVVRVVPAVRFPPDVRLAKVGAGMDPSSQGEEGQLLHFAKNSVTVHVLDADDVPYCQPTPTARSPLTSQVTVRSACVIGIGHDTPAVPSATPISTYPMPCQVPPAAPPAAARSTPIQWACQN